MQWLGYRRVCTHCTQGKLIHMHPGSRSEAGKPLSEELFRSRKL